MSQVEDNQSASPNKTIDTWDSPHTAAKRWLFFGLFLGFAGIVFAVSSVVLEIMDSSVEALVLLCFVSFAAALWALCICIIMILGEIAGYYGETRESSSAL